MVIGFNISPLSTAHSTRGIGSYTKNLLDQLYTMKNIEIVEFMDIKKLKQVDVVHFPYFDLFKHSLPSRIKYPSVITIHDVTPLVFPQHYPAGLKGRIALTMQKLSLKSIDRVITDSRSSKLDINRYLGVNLNKIRVTYLSAGDEYIHITDQNILKDTRRKYSLPKKFAVFIGNINWNKNIVGLAQACINSGLDIILIGSSFLQTDNLDHPELKSLLEFRKRFSDHPLVHILGFVPTMDVVGILSQAELLLFPSFYEGFGIPILEAQKCGVPVITSNISSMPEVAGDSALMINPANIDEISAAIKKIISDTTLRKQLIKNGDKNAAKFSWKKTAIETVQIYDEVIRTTS